VLWPGIWPFFLNSIVANKTSHKRRTFKYHFSYEAVNRIKYVTTFYGNINENITFLTKHEHLCHIMSGLLASLNRFPWVKDEIRRQLFFYLRVGVMLRPGIWPFFLNSIVANMTRHKLRDKKLKKSTNHRTF
jgi:hypothetical protein